MIDVVFRLNSVDYSSLLSTYRVTREAEYPEIVTTMDGTEHGVARYRPVVTFSLIPLTDSQCRDFYDVLARGNVEVVYTNPQSGETAVSIMRLASDINAVFGLKSITGDRYYKCGEITLRSRIALG